MFSPTDHEFHEWTLADFLQENCELPLDGRLAAIADHRCSPTLAKRAVLDFCRLEIGFFLQNDPLAAEAMRRVATLDNGRTPSSPGTEGVLSLIHIFDQAAHEGICAGEVLLEHPRRHLDIGFHGRLGVAPVSYTHLPRPHVTGDDMVQDSLDGLVVRRDLDALSHAEHLRSSRRMPP